MEQKTIFSKKGREDLPIEKMTGFRPPDEFEAKCIEKKIKKNLNQDAAVSLLWTAVSILFTVMYGKMYLENRRSLCLFISAVFFVLTFTGIFRAVFLDMRNAKAVSEIRYVICPVKIDRIIPGFASVDGKAAVRVRDEEGRAYSYEFPIGRKMKKACKKEPDKEFIVIKAETGTYFLSGAPKKVQKEEEEDQPVD